MSRQTDDPLDQGRAGAAPGSEQEGSCLLCNAGPRYLEVLKALSAPVRLKLFVMLRDRPSSSRELAVALAAGPSGVAGHLAVLRRAGLVSRHRRGQTALYRQATGEAAAIARGLCLRFVTRRLPAHALHTERSEG